MLELIGIKKDYKVGDDIVSALKGIDLKFRSSEFVSILGPSGCGKTTTLNIIGGLDQYSEGDLQIDGISTKNYEDRDWDAYRNHSIGFVFQSYNLIPQQTVLQNVEVALALSGVSKSERRKRAKKVLKDVGLGDQLNKRPSEMSGGQMQRVAIARALVNDPDIILADEPTGALDTKTSVQVMDILKEVAKDRLVIMVTHNPELAEQYSTRIIRMLDGKIVDDSKPLTEKEIQMEEVRAQTIQEKKKKKFGKQKKPSLSWGSSFSLSLRNLIIKRSRTALTSFAGSIGIIGIALIYAVSEGFTNYINTIEKETLSTYPLTIEETNTDLSEIMRTFMDISSEETTHGDDDDTVYQKSSIYEIVQAMYGGEESENDLKSFKAYLEEEMSDDESELSEAFSGIQYSYDLDMLVYTKNIDGDIQVSDSMMLMQELLAENMNLDISSMSSNSMMSSMTSSFTLWEEMLTGQDGELINPMLEDQYDVVYGSWPTSYDEIVLVLDKNNELDDITLYALGLESKDSVNEIVSAAINQTELPEKTDEKSWTYEEICDMDFRVILNSDCYSYDETTGLYHNLRDSDTGLEYLYNNGITLKVTGIIKPNEDATATMLSGSIGYTSALTEYVIDNSSESDIIQAQLDDPNTDVTTGLPFSSSSEDITDDEKETKFRNYLDELEDSEKIEIYTQMMAIPTDEELDQMVSDAMSGITREDMESTMMQVLAEEMEMSESNVTSYLKSMSNDDITALYTSIIEEQVLAQYAAQVQASIAEMSFEELLASLEASLDTYVTEQFAKFYDEIIEFSDSTYEDNLTAMGYIDLDTPSVINLYASSFENKDVIEDAIADYNADKDEIDQIKYTDYVGLMMSSITTIINIVTYVLIGFVAISLIVSCIMIAVITLISVQERTKEIGILRALGASKRNVSNMFNVETVLIGLASGILGVVIVYLLCIPLNAIIHSLTGIGALSASLPIAIAIILVIISFVLTLISGLIPSRSAAKKDPVVALRTE
ncbi:MAG: ABC transporter ATP-binding protein/permease, partial [Ruminococcus sp.]|nr:ABC transporter ATP-binding protein/permease [Ruminococcus sp.]